MNSRHSQQPHTRPIRETLGSNATLGSLLARLRESQVRLEAVHRVLPAALRPHVQSGALDSDGWTLLAANGAVAAKLRQCLPQIEQTLQELGWPSPPVSIKVGRPGSV